MLHKSSLIDWLDWQLDLPIALFGPTHSLKHTFSVYYHTGEGANQQILTNHNTWNQAQMTETNNRSSHQLGITLQSIFCKISCFCSNSNSCGVRPTKTNTIQSLVKYSWVIKGQNQGTELCWNPCSPSTYMHSPPAATGILQTSAKTSLLCSWRPLPNFCGPRLRSLGMSSNHFNYCVWSSHPDVKWCWSLFVCNTHSLHQVHHALGDVIWERTFFFISY